MNKKQTTPSQVSLRKFLGEASCAALGTGAALSSLFNLGLVGRLAAEEAPADGDYRALVCVFLLGGNDSYNMLIPRSGEGYDQYQAVRRNLALPSSALLPLNGVDPSGREMGLHPALSNVASLYNSNRLGMVANVGTLREPTTRSSYLDQSARVPDGLFSHADQQKQWQTSIPDRSARTGWLGRMSALVHELNGPDNYASAISVNTVNTMQTADKASPYVIGPDGSKGLTGWNSANWAHGKAAVTSQLDLDYQNLLQKTYVRDKKSAIELDAVFTEALRGTEGLDLDFGSNNLSSQLEMVFKVIKSRENLNVRRQTFFVALGGWDAHAELLVSHNGLVSALDSALGGFQTALDDAGLGDQVTTFTASDFGRSLTSNGDGSDHGWGGNQIVMGGAVNGGKVYGEYPELVAEGPLDTGRGRLIPTTSVDEFFSELACWFGIPVSQIPLVLPNLSRFHDLATGGAPLGFMKSI